MLDKMPQNPWNVVQSLYELQYFKTACHVPKKSFEARFYNPCI